LGSKTFLIVPLGGNAEKYRTAGQAAADNMTHAHSVLDDKINTQAQYVIFTAFLLQQWLHESATLLRCTRLVLILLQVIILVIFQGVLVLQPSCCRRLYFKAVMLQEILISEQFFRRSSEFYDTLVVKDPEISKQVLQVLILQAHCWRSISRTVLLIGSSEGASVVVTDVVILRQSYSSCHLSPLVSVECTLYRRRKFP
jgi:hypothetical protein